MKLLKLLAALALAFPLSVPVSQAAERAVDVSTVVNAGVAEVYKTWATAEGVKTFFAPGAVIEPRSGGLFEIHMNPLAPAGERGADDMRFLALQENKMLTFTWNAPPSLPEVRRQRTLVIVRFAAESENRTRVSVNQVGWGDGGEWDQAYDYFSKAWPYVLGNLKKRFETGPIDWKPALERLKAQTESAAAKK